MEALRLFAQVAEYRASGVRNKSKPLAAHRQGIDMKRILTYLRSLLPRRDRRKSGMLHDDLSVALRKIYLPHYEEE